MTWSKPGLPLECLPPRARAEAQKLDAAGCDLVLVECEPGSDEAYSLVVRTSEGFHAAVMFQ